MRQNYLTNLLKTILTSVFIFLFSQFPANCLGIFGFVNVSPSLVKNNFTLKAGCGAGIVVAEDWEFLFGINNSVGYNIEANFFDSLTNSQPKLVQTAYQLQVNLNFKFSNFAKLPNSLSFSPSVIFGANNIYFRNKYSSIESSENSYTDFGNSWYFSLAPSINFYYEINTWARISSNISYHFPLNLDYKIKNSNNNSLKNKDLQTLSISFGLQLGKFE
jgi:hypothetical protein